MKFYSKRKYVFTNNTIHPLLIFNIIISILYFRRNENKTIFDFFCTESYSKINHRCTRNADKSGLSSKA